MIEALRNMNRVLDAEGDVPTRTMYFSPSEDGENVQLWNTMENVRYREDDIREDIYVRGGSREVPLPSPVNGTIVTMQGVETSFGGTVAEYLIIHTSTGYLYLYNKTADTLTDFGGGHGFSSNTPLTVYVNGRFLYLFDRSAQKAKYIRLNDLSLHTWMGHSKPFILNTTAITTGDISKQNIWGFKEGGEAFVYVLNQGSTDFFFVVDNTNIIAAGVYKYVYNSGRYITLNGRDLTFNEFLVIDEKTEVSIGGAGADPELIEYYDTPFLNTKIDYSPLATKISHIQNIPNGPTFFVKNPWYPGQGFLPIDYVATSDYLVLPMNSDIQELEDSGGAYEFDGTDITAVTDWSPPELTRAYVVLYELDDGSYSLPSGPVYHSIDSTGIFDADGQMQVFGITIATTTTPPSNVVKQHLFGTRWQFDVRNALVPSDKYPNGAFFLIDSIQPDVGEFTDTMPDAKLLRPLSEFIPMSNGIAGYFGGGQVAPSHTTSFKEGLLIAGYRINRPTAQVFKETVLNGSRDIKVVASGSPVADTTLFFVYEYTDNTLSRRFDVFTNQTAIDYTDDTTVYIAPPSALVQAVHVYSYNSSSDTYRLVKRLTSADPEYFGVPLALDADPTTYALVSVPATDSANESVNLDNYLLYGTPFQLLEIDSQKPIPDGARIEGLRILRVDTDRADAIRYQIVVFTELHPYLGYFDARLVEGDLLFQADFEKRAVPTGLKSADSFFLNDYSLFFQGRKGIYLLQSGQVSLVVSEERYPELSAAILDTSYQPAENEVWFLLPNNRCLVIDFDRDAGPPVYEMQFPAEGAVSVTQLTHLDDVFYCAGGGKVLETDDRSLLTDDGFLTSGGSSPVAGLMYSDYLSPADVQLYLECAELWGTGFDAALVTDLQESRFDDGPAWTSAFTEDFDSGFHPLNMKGVLLGVYSRGLAPRLGLKLNAAAGGRLSGMRLYYSPVEHEGAVRF